MVFQRVSTTAVSSIEYFFSSKSNSAMHWINTEQTPRQYVQLYMKQYFPAVQYVISGTPNDGFLLNALKTLFSLPRVLFISRNAF